MASPAEELEAAVRAGSARAISLARALGAEALPRLRALAEGLPSADGRELAVHCVGALDARAEADLAAALGDPAGAVRFAALRALEGRATSASGRALRASLEGSGGPGERFLAAKLLGPLREAVSDARLGELLEDEVEPWVRRGLTLALARRGDPDARRAYVATLREPSGWEAQVDDHLPYLLAAPDAAWLVPALASLLDDRGVARWLGHGAEPEYLRICDVAAEHLGRLLGVPVEPGRRASPEELARARAAARAALGE